MRRHLALVALLLGLLAVAVPNAFAAGPKQKDKDTHVQLLAINDFHGNLEPPAGSSGRISVGPERHRRCRRRRVPGDAHQELRAQNPNTITVGAGDLIGASPLLSGLFHDEPTIEAMNAIGLDVTGVGNHEFDEGIAGAAAHAERRLPPGRRLPGRHAVLRLAVPVPGRERDAMQGTHQTILPAYEIKKVGNAKIAFIGLTLEGTPLIVTPSTSPGSSSLPRSQTINKLVHDAAARTRRPLDRRPDPRGRPAERAVRRRLHGRQPVRQLHRRDQADRRGARSSGRPRRLGPHASAVHLQVQRHPDDERVVVRAPVTDIDLTIDHQSKDVTAVTAHNVIVTRDVTEGSGDHLDHRPATTRWRRRSRTGSSARSPRTSSAAPAGRIGASQESPLGDVIADAQLASTSRSGLRQRGGRVHEPGRHPGRPDLQQQPRGRSSGPDHVLRDLHRPAVQQRDERQDDDGRRDLPAARAAVHDAGPGAIRLLQVSNGFTYSYDFSKPAGSRVTPGSVKINSVPITATGTYRVAMNNFLSTAVTGSPSSTRAPIHSAARSIPTPWRTTS